jgi:hypothetical protein
MRREAERRHRCDLRRAGGVRLFHGASGPVARIIQREGLCAVDGSTAPFLTADSARAEGYAVRAVCLQLYERGLADRPARAPLGAVITFTTAADEVVADPARASDFTAPAGLPADRIVSVRAIDLSSRMPSADAVSDYARRILHARATERQLAVWRPYSTTLNGMLGIAEAALERAREHDRQHIRARPDHGEGCHGDSGNW